MNRTILVTGGAGYVGSHACKALSAAGYTPVVYDDLSSGHERAVLWGPLIKGTLSDRQKLLATIDKYNPSSVLHFAGSISVGESVSDPASYYRNNVIATLDLLAAMRAREINNIIFSSSAAVYGDPEQTPIPESHPTRPTSPYGETKLIVENILRDFARGHDTRSISLRYFNAAGADPDGELGEAHDPETHLIPLVLQAAYGARDSIQVFGDDYPTPDGTCIRDYVHVSDLADAHVSALVYLENLDQTKAEVVNLGNGTGFSVKQVIEAAKQVTGRSFKVEIAVRRSGDPPVLVADSSNALAQLSWKPQHASLEIQMTHAWAWLKANWERADGED